MNDIKVITQSSNSFIGQGAVRTLVFGIQVIVLVYIRDMYLKGAFCHKVFPTQVTDPPLFCLEVNDIDVITQTSNSVIVQGAVRTLVFVFI